jgi:serine/threonine protein kinase
MKGGPVPFGKYLLVDRINVGGMAEVFMAKAFGVEGFERVLAIKRILPNMADDDEFINMFVDEARIAVQLSHANVVQVYELGKFENQYYIAMEYVSGKDLRQILDAFRKRGQTLPFPAAAFIAGKICEGLDYAHRKGDPSGRPLNVIHRDVSPQNILVSFEGAVKITDFGIAKAEDRASKTQAGVLKGKFGYMSPEQVRGLTIDHRSDIFAVGILLYEMVTGKRLFIGESDFSTLEKVRNAEVVPPRQHNPKVSEALEHVMLKALARERDERYAWASDLHDDLQQFLIEDNTVYNAKRVAALLKQEFAEDINKERARMEEFVRAQMPSSYHAPEPTPATSHAATDNRSEKTMIFESAAEAKGGRGGATEAKKGRPAADDEGATGAARVSAVAKKPAPGLAAGKTGKAKAPPRQSKAGLVIVGLALLVSAAVLGTVLFGLPSGGTGTIVVTSEPVTEVDIFLDEQPIGSRTPITRTDVPTGVHTLRARAKGYGEKMYRFELEGSAVIPVRLEVASGGAPVAGPPGPSGGAAPTSSAKTSPTPVPPAPAGAPTGAVHPAGVAVEVLSDPPEAKVRVGGISQGVTPLVLNHPDPAQTLVFEVSKPDFKPVTETVTFKPGEARRTVKVKLSPAVGTAVRSRLVVRSTPDGATVWSGPNRLGVTPLEIPNLDPSQSYSLRLVKEGFREHETTVAMQGRSDVTVTADLDKLKPAPGAHKPPSEKPKEASVATPAVKEPREPKEPKEPGTAAATGTCAGTGAKLSVMAKGEPDCKVTVGRASLGVSPFVNKDAPTGKCDIVVACPSGKKYTETRTLKPGAPEKVIIEAAMWK